MRRGLASAAVNDGKGHVTPGRLGCCAEMLCELDLKCGARTLAHYGCEKESRSEG